jgi:hypothetical protein
MAVDGPPGAGRGDRSNTETPPCSPGAVLHADLAILAKLLCALSGDRAVVLMVAQRRIQNGDPRNSPLQVVHYLLVASPPLLSSFGSTLDLRSGTLWRPGGA